jgi:hypothetical protein
MELVGSRPFAKKREEQDDPLFAHFHAAHQLPCFGRRSHLETFGGRRHKRLVALRIEIVNAAHSLDPWDKCSRSFLLVPRSNNHCSCACAHKVTGVRAYARFIHERCERWAGTVHGVHGGWHAGRQTESRRWVYRPHTCSRGGLLLDRVVVHMFTSLDNALVRGIGRSDNVQPTLGGDGCTRPDGNHLACLPWNIPRSLVRSAHCELWICSEDAAHDAQCTHTAGGDVCIC